MNLSTFLDSVGSRASFQDNGIYIVSVDLPDDEGLYKVGMADVGSLATRMGNFQTLFFPIRKKVKIHMLANKPNGRRVSLTISKNMITASRHAEQNLHTTIKNAGWDNTGTGEWFRAPRPLPREKRQTVEDLIAMANDHPFGNKSKYIKADGGHCKFCVLTENNIIKKGRPKRVKEDVPDVVPLEEIRRGTRVVIPSLDVNGNLRTNLRP